jgi:septal ring factor EnvC (AmiA/AmiB activator)
MTTKLEDFIKSFNGLPVWKKLLLFIPLILAAFAVAFITAKNDAINDKNSRNDEIKKSKIKTDKNVKSFEKKFKKAEKELLALEKENEDIELEIHDEKTNYINIVNRIDSASVDELSGIASELRKRSSSDIE